MIYRTRHVVMIAVVNGGWKNHLDIKVITRLIHFRSQRVLKWSSSLAAGATFRGRARD